MSALLQKYAFINMLSKTDCTEALRFSYLSHGVGHFLAQVLQKLLSDYVGADLFRGLVGQNLTVVVPGSCLGLHHQVPLRETEKRVLRE